MTLCRGNVADIREAVLLREREALRAELVKLACNFARHMNGYAREVRPRWMLDMDSRRATRIATLLRHLGAVQEKLWRRRQGANL